MEFFKIINCQTSKDQIQQNINFDNLNDLCESLFVVDYNNNLAEIGSNWGEFSLQKDNINGGLRFSLLECPNALTFTITTGFPPEPNKIVIHLTVNRFEIKPLFIEEINDLLNDWEVGLLKNYSS
jgi:hypothetical protein